VVQRRERGAVLGGDAVGGERDDGEAEGERELPPVGLELGVSGGDVGARGAGLLQFDYRDGHAVEVEDDVEAPLDVAVHHGDLVDHQPVVPGSVRADQADGRVLLLTRVVDVGQSTEALGEEAVGPEVLGDRVLGGGGDDDRERLLEVLARDAGVQAAQRGA